MNDPQINEVLEFWFNEPMNKNWFSSTPEIDQSISNRFQPLWSKAQSGELNDWMNTPDGCLALCIILDQFPLNMFRGKIESFSTEQRAVEIAKHAIEQGFDSEITTNQVTFLYMPLMHSENMDDQNQSVSSFEKTNLDGNIRFAKHHRGIVEKFGRFPHRNNILNRESTPQEMEYLNSAEAFTG